MKKLQAFSVKDSEIIKTLSKNTKLSSYPHLGESLPKILNQYENYVASKGDASLINAPIPIASVLANAMRAHYASEVLGLDFIEEIRGRLSPDVCPLCGGFHPTTVDHVIPKEDYPEYSFFSPNLVPACSCNTKKGRTYKGKNFGERILHPYYDDILTQRTVYLSIDGPLDFPTILVKVVQKFDANPALQFHVENIINRTNILSWAAKKWANIIRRPNNIFPRLNSISGPCSAIAVQTCIEELLTAKDEELETPNNWESMLYFGCTQRPETYSFIAEKLDFSRANPHGII